MRRTPVPRAQRCAPLRAPDQSLGRFGRVEDRAGRSRAHAAAHGSVAPSAFGCWHPRLAEVHDRRGASQGARKAMEAVANSPALKAMKADVEAAAAHEGPSRSWSRPAACGRCASNKPPSRGLGCSGCFWTWSRNRRPHRSNSSSLELARLHACNRDGRGQSALRRTSTDSAPPDSGR